MNDDRALVLFSGGQDSTICLTWALERFAHVETVGFDYGQRHRVEPDCRQRVAEALRARFPQWAARLGADHLVDLRSLGAISDTALTRDAAIAFEKGGDAHRATGDHRRRRGVVGVGRTDGLSRHPRRYLADRHGDPQLGDPDRPARRARRASLARGNRCHGTSPAADHAHRGRGDSRRDPDRTHGILGPMAYAVMGGLAVATALTLVFLPALYIVWFRIKPPAEDAEPAVAAGDLAPATT